MEKALWYLLAGTRGGENRARIIRVLDDRPRNANQIAEELDVDYNTVRHHLDMLLEHDVIEQGGDDYGAMREVIRRRYRRIKNEDGPWPDLVVIDGGKGQLSSAVESLEETDTLGRFPVIGLAKRLEEVFRPGDSDPYHIAKDSSALQLLQKVRDEAHRFAVTFQRKQRKQKTLHSELLDIGGIGPKTVQKLMREFGSAKRVEEADPSALEEVIGPAKTQKIRAYYANGKAAKREHE